MEILIFNSKGGCGKTTLAMAMADVLDAKIVEHDPQRTIANCHLVTGRHKPVDQDHANGKFIIHDTPPYNSDILRSLVERADKIIIPVRVSIADLVALKTAVDLLRATNTVGRAIVVFNGVRRPHTNTYKEVRAAFLKNYKDVRKATTEIPNLVSFQRVLMNPITGAAKKLVLELMNEFNIY